MKRLMATLLALSAGALALWQTEAAVSGVRAGLSLCLHSVIPSLFIFMIFADFLAEADLSPALFWPLRLICRLFQVPGEAAPVLAISLVGGYPAGARLIASLVKKGRLGPKTGEKLLCSCFCCSPSFLTGAVGLGVFGNVRIGLIMYLCQLGAMLVTGLLAGFLLPGDDAPAGSFSGSGDYTACLVSAVTSAGKAVAAICCFVLAFSAVRAFLLPLPGGETLAGLLEVTVGCAGAAGYPFRKALILSTIYTSLGGVCVWMQLRCFLQGSGVSMKKFFWFRCPHCFFSVGLTLLAARLTKIAADVFTTFSQPLPKNGSSSVTAAVTLVMLCLMLLLTLPKFQLIRKGAKASHL